MKKEDQPTRNLFLENIIGLVYIIMVSRKYKAFNMKVFNEKNTVN